MTQTEKDRKVRVLSARIKLLEAQKAELLARPVAAPKAATNKPLEKPVVKKKTPKRIPKS